MSDKEQGMKNAGEMFRAFIAQQGFGDEAKNAARMMHDLYTSLKDEGFDEKQAMSIILTMVGAGARK